LSDSVETTPLDEALERLQQLDDSFVLKDFMEGAASAYETITAAFAQGDMRTLERSVSPEVYKSFAAAVAERERRGHRSEVLFVRVEPPQLVDANIRDGAAEISVRFRAEMFRATRDAAGVVVDGDPERSAQTVDLWVFAKPLASSLSSGESAWMLVAANVG
jgi:predicted lipid-binding transport protein (Tim44 family)